MPKYYKKRSYRRREKYSVENIGKQFNALSGSDSVVEIVSPTDVSGMRKVKHLVISGGSDVATGTFLWALVYVPQGTAVNSLSMAGGSIYEPNQFVMVSGIWDTDAGPLRIRSPVSRNLNKLIRFINRTTSHR